ncbi:ABC transporter ATP-binding protein [Pontixanthobacter gangjinensis]|uniref:ABC transporter ATP-binding protein n=1 Tax=Christiangramia aestuarii TaxID=1028746 RepID=A0A7K1LM33_9FLAO|nr:ABC transporter ATP-binding protein [Christiangramia aestuarii]MUP41793.1 ABC transporter ATP-binding protein [Christiangramia aestuarii]
MILKAENISKQYRLGTVGAGTLGEDLKRIWYKIQGKEDPFLKVGAVNQRNSKADGEDYVWALRDINFEVNEGEVLGIIGKNGAGKSTLLKLLSRVTAPTTGSIKTKGRIASLLEVGTGFHGELTGRENIFMNGAVLGMTKTEIRKKLDEIIAFSGCERYIDTPVKRYSSGMTVRLGFAVAAHLEPDILVVDEVLAVGDAEFQKKAIGKMQNLSEGQGRTVLFVSHNMGSIKSLCDRVIVLDDGGISFDGDTEEAINFYLTKNLRSAGESLKDRIDRSGSGIVKLEKIQFLNAAKRPVDKLISGLKSTIRLYYYAQENLNKVIVGIAFFDRNGNMLSGINNDEQGYFLKVKKGQGYFDLEFDKLPLYGGLYFLNIIIGNQNTLNKLDAIEGAVELEVVPGDYFGAGKDNRRRNTPVLDAKYRSFSNE